MKKNKMMRLASLLLVCVLLTTSVISGTFAKYISTATSNDTARVAKWDIKLNGDSIQQDTFNFNLFETVLDSDGTVEANVKNQTTDGMTVIAPGTSGNFVIDLKNDSEVSAKYSVNYVLTNPKSIPVEFSVDGKTWNSNIGELKADDVNLPMGSAASITVQWRWVFERNADDVDTDDFGIKAIDETIALDVVATVVVEQVD